MEKYLKWARKTEEDDGDVVNLEDVEVLVDIAQPEGPKKGQRFLKVTWVKFTDTVLFRKQDGGCRVVSYDGKNEPKYKGTLPAPPVV